MAWYGVAWDGLEWQGALLNSGRWYRILCMYVCIVHMLYPTLGAGLR